MDRKKIDTQDFLATLKSLPPTLVAKLVIGVNDDEETEQTVYPLVRPGTRWPRGTNTAAFHNAELTRGGRIQRLGSESEGYNIWPDGGQRTKPYSAYLSKSPNPQLVPPINRSAYA